MQSIKLQTHVGDDGLLEIKLPRMFPILWGG